MKKATQARSMRPSSHQGFQRPEISCPNARFAAADPEGDLAK
jgi:hypothetical protein